MALIVGNKVARHAHWLVLEEECQRGAIDRKSLVTIDSRVTPMSGQLAPKLCARVTVLFMLTCSMCIDVVYL